MNTNPHRRVRSDIAKAWKQPASAVATSEPQEWTPEYVRELVFPQVRGDDTPDAWQRVAAAHNAAIAAERERRQPLEQQLLAAQAAIERLIQLKGKCPWCGYIPHAEGCFMSLDFSALREHDAEVRKPLVEANLRLVEALEYAKGHVPKNYNIAHATIDAALALATASPSDGGQVK